MREGRNGRPRILFVVNVDWFFWAQWLDIARAARERGADVWVAAAPTQYGERILKEGLRFVPLPFTRSGKRPAEEMRTLLALCRLLRALRPALVHNITIKPVIYGSWAARLTGAGAVVNGISGLGYVFIEPGLKGRLLRAAVRTFYRCAFARRGVRAIFQNPDDLEEFVSGGLIGKESAVLIRGSGVDTGRFAPAPEPPGPPVMMLASRLLRHKGVEETVEAARLLRRWGVACRAVLVGDPDPENPASVTEGELRAWVAEGCVEWWGYRTDMEKVLAEAAVVVLPSYREGLPKVLLEAAAAGRPIVTADVPGCREAVLPGENGLLVPPRDPLSLARALRGILEDPGLRARMGRASRVLAEKEFRIEKIVEDTLSVYDEMLSGEYPGVFARRAS